MSEREIHVHLHLEGLGALVAIGERILHEVRELKHMSQTNQDRIDANNAAMQATLDGIQTDITAITAELQAAIPAPGTVPSQASLDALQANVDRLTAVKAALDGLVVPAPAA